ncbi:piggyBac transposable element-derived protein 4-like [Ischnura elegans]|uniref:piggyBac transposable element-derived protein 4-like n=1 Tax=Ischnura elegans TaxID=197161 RepID=UPI001ED87B6F|nr:piggyBac transposable element-derived protein 4-like [Ischnura elegans]
MAGQKILSQDDIQKLLNIEGTSDDDMDYQSIEEESSSEGDNESAASEVSDYDSENFSDTEATAESERPISFLSHLRSNHTSYDVLWSQLYGPPIFRATMGLKRFKYLLAFIRFDDKATRSVRRQKDKFAPIREVWERLNTNFKKHYLPGSNITVDEQLIPYRGKCPFKQYMPSKPDKYGMKVWWACDSETFYPLNSLPYLGKEGGERALPGLGRRVVQQLTEPYQKTNRNVTCDNYFTDMELAQNLLSNGLTLVGTVRKNKGFIPVTFQANKSREVGSSLFGFTANSTLVSYVPKMRRSVVLLSTMHHSNTVMEDVNTKPEIINHYNSTKGGVDSLDQLVHAYMCKRRTNRWPFAFFMNGLDVSGVAACVVWMNTHPNWNADKHYSRRLFIQSVSESLVQVHIERRSNLGRVVSGEDTEGKEREYRSLLQSLWDEFWASGEGVEKEQD